MTVSARRYLEDPEEIRVHGISAGLKVCIVRAKELLPDMNQARRYKAFLNEKPEKLKILVSERDGTVRRMTVAELKTLAREFIELLEFIFSESSE
jgi:hypothetical protein